LNTQPNQSAPVFRLDLFRQFPTLMHYQSFSGYEGLARALAKGPTAVIGEITAAGLRGRGGAAFPTGAKMKMVAEAPAGERYVICNADEGEPGTFKDRFILTHIPFQLLEGMTIAALAVGAHQGFIYIRHEYPEAQETMRYSIAAARAAGLLGPDILGSGFAFDIELFSGAGSYLCGEETALLSSMEGKKGRPRLKPPYPTESGLWGKPTLINNVETIANIPPIIAHGPDWYHGLGTVDSPGTKLISLSGDVVRRGIYEIPFGTSFRQIIEDYGGGLRNGRTLKAVNIGGASGVVVPPEELDCLLEYRACGERGITIGSGAVFVMDESRSILENVRNRVEFFLHESCGKCTPCREGLRQAGRIVARVLAGEAALTDVANLERYTRVLQNAAFCGLGQAAGNSLASSLKYFRHEYEAGCLADYRQPPEEATA
jgi:NADH-quinone oxidoreductase subunit F